MQYKHRDPEIRFWAKVLKTDSCWLWLGAKTSSGGYGNFKLNSSNIRAHRYAYQLLVGPIPEELMLDHLCRVPACVNPAHLEPVTNSENLHRGKRGVAATHCPKGHPYDLSNTYVYRGWRYCRTCKRLGEYVRRLVTT